LRNPVPILAVRIGRIQQMPKSVLRMAHERGCAVRVQREQCVALCGNREAMQLP
jgi:hypothetical protein